MIAIPFENRILRLRKTGEKTQVFDRIRKRWVVLSPEEHVRQLLILYLTEDLQYPASLIAVEKKIMVGSRSKRYDLVVYGPDHRPWMLVECKEPAVPITEQTLFQLITYHSAIACKYWLLSNGHQNFCAEVTEGRQIKWLTELPAYR